MTTVAQAAAALAGAERLVVFTGAGVSRESGIDTFREAGGLWERFPPDTFGSPQGLARLLATNPRGLAGFIRAVIEPVARAEPNAAHRALSALEEHHRLAHRRVVTITQNVDRLHQRAGSREVLEIHGSLYGLKDGDGNPRGELSRDELLRVASALARVEKKRFFVVPALIDALRPILGLRVAPPSVSHRPDLVLFGESMAEPAWTKAQRAVDAADALLVIGTSGLVEPAASIPQHLLEKGLPVVGVGPERGDLPLWIEGTAGSVVPDLVAALTA